MSRLRTLALAAALLSASPALAAKKPLATGERIDLGRASAAELMRLQGVGRKKAEAIVALRTRTPLRRVEDVLAVKGISSRWLEKQRGHLSVSAAPPVTAAGRSPAPAGRHAK